MNVMSGAKSFEGRIADRMGGTHVRRDNFGVSAPDVVTDDLVVECKLRAGLALDTWMTQCEGYAGSRVPAVVCKLKGRHDDNAMICFRLSDFEKW
ncbi:MAG: hypothetical protein KKF41_08675 [Actinobacteria bacterium]|nr:hypothetical protein [Actinomycetota bacterium]MBU1942914.1 hypothetical protein [Actinomycetota bacterium]MBU2687646.1 hypothetical protein [Actinomycetota bacterium]